jgi:hypothetical protein
VHPSRITIEGINQQVDLRICMRGATSGPIDEGGKSLRINAAGESKSGSGAAI